MRAGKVAPFAGAWIETVEMKCDTNRSLVAPFAGAWIETSSFSSCGASTTSPPSRGRGSKPRRSREYAPAAWSPPSRGRGSKHRKPRVDAVAVRSPLRGGVDRNPAGACREHDARATHNGNGGSDGSCRCCAEDRPSSSLSARTVAFVDRGQVRPGFQDCLPTRKNVRRNRLRRTGSRRIRPTCIPST